jgi:hypothetical protein
LFFIIVIIICFVEIKKLYDTKGKSWLAKNSFSLKRATKLWGNAGDIGSLFIIHYYLKCKNITKGIKPDDATYLSKLEEETMMLDKIKLNLFMSNSNKSVIPENSVCLFSICNKDNILGVDITDDEARSAYTIEQLIGAVQHNNNISYSSDHFYFVEWQCGSKYNHNMKEFIKKEFVQYFTEQIMILLEQTNISDIENYDESYKVNFPRNSSLIVIDLDKEEVVVVDEEEEEETNINNKKTISSISSGRNLETEFNNYNTTKNNQNSSLPFETVKDDNTVIATSNNVVELEDTLVEAFNKGGEECFLNAMKVLEKRFRNKFATTTGSNVINNLEETKTTTITTPQQFWTNKTTRDINNRDISSSFVIQPKDEFDSLIDKISNTEKAEEMYDEMIAKIMERKQKLTNKKNI